MSVLGGIFTGNSELDPIFTLIDEKLSELYSLHGAQLARGTPILSNSIQNTTDLTQGAVPNFDNLYRNLIPRAAGYTDSTGNILWAVNLQFSPGNPTPNTVRFAAGIYEWAFIRPPSDTNYVLVLGVDTPGNAVYAPQIASKSSSVFRILTRDNAGVAQDQGNYVVAFWA